MCPRRKRSNAGHSIDEAVKRASALQCLIQSALNIEDWCFFKGQRAIFLEETRERQCPNGVQVQTRTVLVHCGC